MRDPKDDNDHLEHLRLAWDRRQFGKVLVAGVGGLTLGGLASAQSPEPKPDVTVDVVIVGAGLSGLIAARELKRAAAKAGKQITLVVLEARDRIGGRMYGETVSVRNEKGENELGYVDFGGQWVGDTQTEMLALVTELNIEKFLSWEEGRSIQSWKPRGSATGQETGFDGDVSHLLKGDCVPPHISSTDAKCKEPPVLPDCQKNSEEAGVWNGLLALPVDAKQPWKSANARTLDSRTFQDYLNDAEAYGYTKWLPTMQSHIGGSGGFEPEQVSLLHMAWSQKVAPQSETPEKWLLKGGAGQIPEKLEEQLGPCILKGAPVTDIRHDIAGGGVIVTTTRPVNEPLNPFMRFKARAVIIAIPPPLRKKIKFDPPLSLSYTGFMNGSPMGSMSKVHAVYDRAFWRDKCLSGSAAGNLKTCEFIADSSLKSGEPGILTSFIAAERNHCLRDASEAEVQELVLRDYAYYFGEAALTPKKFYHVNWDTEMWTGGAFTSFLLPNIWTLYGEQGWREPVDKKIFWAGTETSDRWPGYFDGAIRAGIRAAGEVKDQVKIF
jgi:monoamine oxidase